MSRNNNNSNKNNNNKKTKGKQKIEIKYIEMEENRLVTFSKRKSRIFKKASELATLTGSQVAIVINSPTKAGKPYSFGHPSTDDVIKRFLGKEEAKDMADRVVEAKRMSDVNVLRKPLDAILTKVDLKKQNVKKLNEQNEAEGGEEVEAWWNTPIEQYDKEGLVETIDMYKQLLVEIFSKFQEKTYIDSGASSSGSSNVAPPPVPAKLVSRFPTSPEYK